MRRSVVEKRNKETRQPPPPLPRRDAGAPIPQEEEVRSLVAKGKTKAAVELAKEIHKRCGRPESEALLVDAYGARIWSLQEAGLKKEAKELFELVRARHSGSSARLVHASVLVSASDGNLDGLLRPLGDPVLPVETRRAIEKFVKDEVCDLNAVAQCATLAADHPLSTAASALVKAFAAVTTGPVEEPALALPEVSHRSALASWKMLVRAVAYFYRQDDQACERCLELIDPASAPARLIPAMRTMLGAGTRKRLPPATESLVERVCGNTASLRGALQTLDSAFQTIDQVEILVAIQRATVACSLAYPELLERLRQHISVRALELQLPLRKVRAAMGGPSIKNAYFWRLLAWSEENSRKPMELLICAHWEQFRRHAVAEGWFQEKSQEAAALYLHMAGLLLDMPAEMLNNLRKSFMARFSGFEAYYEDQPPAIRAVETKGKTPDFYFLSPDELFERACSIDPHREAFDQWLNWAREEYDWQVADYVAERWHEALPHHCQPLLYLMESAENRGALNKATAFLEEVQKLDAVNPEVRRAALRLLVFRAARHLRQRKPHLVEQDLAALEALPQAQEGDRPAFLAALRWACEVIRGNTELAASLLSQIGRLLRNSDAAVLACRQAGKLGGLKQADLDQYLRQEISLDSADSLASAVARVCALVDDMGATLTIPKSWHGRLAEELAKGSGKLESRQMDLLGKAALRDNQRELAYLISARGLGMGGNTQARFLLLRARALPEWEVDRRNDCIAAVVELGRRQRDLAVIKEAVELRRALRNPMWSFFWWLDSESWHDSSMTTEEINAVLQREQRFCAFPEQQASRLRTPFGENTASLCEEELETNDEFPTLEDAAHPAAEMSPPREKRQKKDLRDFPVTEDLF
ncbi:MAG: hypothetical protein DMG40_27200 [Acidobacteria bacterium]|nr:MAG: hypothetical protein DMG40_27200 [Acidobacteriota bacterium]